MKSIKRMPREGFTFIEVIVGMTIMSLAITAAFGAFFLGMRIIEESRDEIRASQIIQTELEAMRTLNWLDLEKLPVSEAITPKGEFIRQFSSRFTVTRDVQDVDGRSGAQKYVVLRVAWQTAAGNNQVRYFNTVFTRFGLNDYYVRSF